MIYIDNPNLDPSYNHAIEEYFLKETDDAVFMLWQNDKTVLLGRHQSMELEVDIPFCSRHHINIVRRRSGGGAIYCDQHNMQYSFISTMESGNIHFSEFAKPVVHALQKLGLHAEFTGRNDILLEGKKISGNAQYRYKNRILHHGSILFDVDLAMLQGSLRSRRIKFTGKSVQSVISRVGLIKDYITMPLGQFMQYICSEIVAYHHITEQRGLTLPEQSKIETLTGCFPKLVAPDPTGTSPHATTPNICTYSIKHPFGLVEYSLILEDNLMEEFNITGDFFAYQEMNPFLDRFKKVAINQIDSMATDVDKYIIGMDKQTFLRDFQKLLESRR